MEDEKPGFKYGSSSLINDQVTKHNICDQGPGRQGESRSSSPNTAPTPTKLSLDVKVPPKCGPVNSNDEKRIGTHQGL